MIIRARLTAVAVSVLLTVAALGGCATTIVGTPSPDPAPRPTAGVGADPVAWGGTVCGALVSYYTPLQQRPNYDGADPASIRDRLSRYLGNVLDGLNQGQAQLSAVGPSPVSGGDQFATAIRDLLSRTTATVTAAKADVDSADPSDPNNLQNKLGDAQNKLKTIGSTQGLDKLGATPRLDKAVAAAPQCQQLKTMAAA